MAKDSTSSNVDVLRPVVYDTSGCNGGTRATAFTSCSSWPFSTLKIPKKCVFPCFPGGKAEREIEWI